MEQLFDLCDRFSGSAVSERWRSLLELYHIMELETEAFQRQFNVRCPEGCGTCCEHFIPDLSEIEASLIAAYLLYVKQDERFSERLQGTSEQSGACPLYNAGSPFHCTVYPVRGMICRLFGACASEDKDGHPVFRRCKHNTDPTAAATLTRSDFAASAAPVPTMQRYGVQFNALEARMDTATLSEAVLREMNRLRFISAYLGSGSNDDDNGGSDPLLPEPQAS